MKASDELFQLVKSLDKNEKRYFRLFSQLHSGNKVYLKLFEAVEDQKNYDEKKLKEVLGDPLLVKRLSTEKVLLYKHILRSLELYYSSDTDFKIQSQMRHVKILINKGLYKQCEKILTTAKKNAGEQEDFLTHMGLLELEARLIKERSYPGKGKRHIDTVFKECYHLLDQKRNLYQYSNSMHKLGMNSYKEGISRSVGSLRVFNAVFNQPLLKNEKYALSYKALFNYYQCHMLYYNQAFNYEKLLEYCEKAVKLLDRIPIVQDFARRYTNIILDILEALALLKKFSRMPVYIKKLQELPFRLKRMSDAQKNWIEYLSCYSELKMFIGIGDFNAAVKKVVKGKEIIERYDLKLHKHLEAYFFYLAAYAYFGKGDYRSAKKHLHLTNNIKEEASPDVLVTAKILNLIIYFEERDDSMLEYAMKSTYRFLLKTKRAYKYENIMLSFVRKSLPKIKNQTQLTEDLKHLKKEVIIILKDPFEKQILNHFDIISWLESKIQNRSFAEIIRRKAHKRK